MCVCVCGIVPVTGCINGPFINTFHSYTGGGKTQEWRKKKQKKTLTFNMQTKGFLHMTQVKSNSQLRGLMFRYEKRKEACYTKVS